MITGVDFDERGWGSSQSVRQTDRHALYGSGVVWEVCPLMARRWCMAVVIAVESEGEGGRSDWCEIGKLL